MLSGRVTSHGELQNERLEAICPFLAGATREEGCFIGLSSRWDAVSPMVDTTSSEG
jgi:hypothetical protein